MKKKIVHFCSAYGLSICVSLLITIIAVIPFFFDGLYRGHDLQFHLSRLDGIVSAIADKQFPLALYPYKNFGYGYPSPLFYSDLYLIIPAVIRHFLQIPLITMYKNILGSCVFATVFSMMHISYKLSGNRLLSITVSCLFVFSNYYQTDLFIRSALGELLAFVVFPWLIYNIYLFVYQKKHNEIMLGVLFAALLYAHVISFVLAVIFFALLLLLNVQHLISKERLVCLVKAAVIGFLLAMGFLVPMLEQYGAQTLMVHKIETNLLEKYALSFNSLFSDFAPQFSFQYFSETGLLHADDAKSLGFFLIVLPLLMIFKRKKSKIESDLLLLFILFVLCSSQLIPLYKIDLLGFIQFPSRMYLIALVLSCFLISIFLNNRRVHKLFVVFVIAVSLWNLSYLHSQLLNESQVVIIKEEADQQDLFVDRIYAFVDPSYSLVNVEEVENAEYLPANWDYDYQHTSKCIVFESGVDALCSYERTGSTFDFYTDFLQNERLRLPVTWYKGYAVYEVDDSTGEMIQKYVWPHKDTSQVSMEAEAGFHHYIVTYHGTRIQKYSALISCTVCLILLIWHIYTKKGLCSK